jgi:hypothetical protein
VTLSNWFAQMKGDLSRSALGGISGAEVGLIARVFCCLLAGLLLMPSFALAQTAPANLDLSSTQRDQVAGAQGSIVVGGVQQAVNPTDLLTPAEYLALTQVLGGGQQTLQIGQTGNAIGGTINLSTFAQNPLGSLLIPQGVTAIHDFGQAGNLSVLGNLTNSGTLYAISTNPNITAGTFNAANIFNNQSALLSSMLPTGGLQGFNSAISSLSLTLNAVQNIINAGQILSSGNLTAIAGGSIVNALPAGITGVSPVMQAMQNLNLQASTIVNQGVLAAQLGNINATTALLNNSNVMQALSGSVAIQNLLSNTLSVTNLLGSIQARDKILFETLASTFNDSHDLVSKANINLTGGMLQASSVDFISPQGKVAVTADSINGRINVSAGEAEIGVTGSGQLELGDMTITGDPTFYNTAGNVLINGALSFSGQPLAIIASGDILSGPLAGAISTSNASGSGGALTLVAGALFTSSGGTSVLPPGVGDTSSTISITGGSVTGGKIDLSNITSLTSQSTGGGGAGGAINIVAFSGANSGSNPGTIVLPAAVTVNAGGNGAGANGSITILAGASSGGNSITTGAISSTGGTAGGTITLNTASPQVGSGVTILNGAITGGAFSSGATQVASINTGAVTASSGTININSGANYAGGALSATSGSTSGGTVSVATNSATAFNIGGGGVNGTTGAITANAAAGSGNGGTVNIYNSGSGGISLGTSGNLSVTSGTGGTGGTILLDATSNGGTGSLSFPGTVTLTASGTGASGHGGTITLNSTNALSSTAVLTLTANAGTTANGGVVNVNVTSTTGDITVNTPGANTIAVNAEVTKAVPEPPVPPTKT